jgi:hypothetical protein
MEFWIVGTIHCKGRHTINFPSYAEPCHPPTGHTYLLDQPHLELGEEQLREEQRSAS